MGERVYLVRREARCSMGYSRDVANFNNPAEAEKYASHLAAAEGTVRSETIPESEERLFRIRTADYDYHVIERRVFGDAEEANDRLLDGFDMTRETDGVSLGSEVSDNE